MDKTIELKLTTKSIHKQHELKWNSDIKMFECEHCHIRFGATFTYPVNSLIRASEIIAMIENCVEDDSASADKN